jgi:predicted nucleic acid-binding protein
LIDVEAAQVLRRYAANPDIGAQRGGEALDDLASISMRRYGHEMLLPRVWQLRENITAYDAVYFAHAEALDAPLLTPATAVSPPLRGIT